MTSKKCIVFCLPFCFIANYFAQTNLNNFEIKGQLVTEGGSLKDELIFLFSEDSILVKTSLTDEEGRFVFYATPTSYFVAVKNPYYLNYTSALFNLNKNLDLETLKLEAKIADLEQVTVRALKPVIERLPGKMIFNVEQSLQSTGSSAWEIISKAPGVTVNSTDNILINGKGGVVIQINGKPLRMSGSDLADYLRGLGSAAIEKIEFITNPSASMDAAGNVVIDIRMKKDARLGTNGSFSANVGHGFYPKAGANFQINRRTDKWTCFLNFGYTYRKGFNDLRLDRKFYNGDSLYLVYDQKNYMTFPFKNQLLRTGLEYSPSKNNVIALTLSGSQNGFTRNGQNLSTVLNGQNEKVSSFVTDIGGSNRWANGGANLNYQNVSDTLGSCWLVDADYSHFINRSKQEITTNFYDINHMLFANTYSLYGDLNGFLDIFALKVDRQRYFASAKIEYGAKSSYVQADNDVQFFDRSTGQYFLDSTKSNHFLYDEFISAGYFAFDKQTTKWKFNLGLRGEYTQIYGKQLVKSQQFDSSYFQLFPSASFGFTPSEKHQMNLNLNRRIERPGYGQLNPFKYYLDPTTYREGNPYLRPQSTYTAEIEYTFLSKYYLQLGVSHTENNIIEIIAPSSFNQTITVQTNVNLKGTDLLYLNLSFPFQVKSWWTLRFDAGVYQALYSGNVANTQLSSSGTNNGNAQMVNQFVIGKLHSIEVTGNVQSRERYAFDIIRPRGGLGFGYQYRCLKGKGALRLNVSDLLYTEKIFANVSFTGYKEYFEVRRETRVATLSFSYRFGNGKAGGPEKRDGGAEDLKQRAGGGLG